MLVVVVVSLLGGSTLLLHSLGVSMVLKELQHLLRLVPEVGDRQGGAGVRAFKQMVGVVGGRLTFGAFIRYGGVNPGHVIV